MAYLEETRLAGRWTLIQEDGEGNAFAVCGPDPFFGTVPISMEMELCGGNVILSDRGASSRLAEALGCALDGAALAGLSEFPGEVWTAPGGELIGVCGLGPEEAVEGFARLVHNAPCGFSPKEGRE